MTKTPENLPSISARIVAAQAHRVAWNRRAGETNDLEKIEKSAEDAAWAAAMQNDATPQQAEEYAKYLTKQRKIHEGG